MNQTAASSDFTTVKNSLPNAASKTFLLFILLFSFSLTAQQVNTDSLKKELSTPMPDSTKFQCLLLLTENSPDGEWEKFNEEMKAFAEKKIAATKDERLKKMYSRYFGMSLNNEGYLFLQSGELAKSLVSFNKALEIGQSISDLSLSTSALSNIGSINVQQGHLTQALEVFLKCAAYQKKTGDKEGEANSLNNIAYIYQNLGDIIKALEHHFTSLKIREHLKDSSGMAYSFINIASLYSSQNDSTKAFEYYFKCLKLFERMQNKRGIAQAMNNLAGLLSQYQKHEEARSYYFKSLQLSEESNTKQVTAQILAGIGQTFKVEGNYKKAEEFFLKAGNIFKEIDDRKGLAGVYQKTGASYFYQNNYGKAIEYGEKALSIANELHMPELEETSANLLYKVYKQTGKSEKALTMYEQMITARDKITSEKNKKALFYDQFKYEFEHKEELIAEKAKAEKEKFEIQSREEKRQRNIITYSSAILILFGMVFIFFVLRSKRKIESANKIITQQKEEVELQKHLVEEKATELAARHKEITDSINYAERIQRSFLATQKHLNTYLNEYFVLFKPKDVVSGDFYWSATLNNGAFAMVTADSTGHGVPGAIMSLLNITSLEKAIETCESPSDILNATRKIIIERLKKDGSAEGGKDGMDCSLCVYDFKHLILKVAAAHNPVWIVRATETIEIKPDKMPVGKHDNQHLPFAQHEIQLQKGDVIYTLSDGFADQFGGKEGKKFMSKKLRELLAAHAHLPMNKQKELLNNTFTEWVGSLEQVDDVTVIGIRV